MHTHTHTRSLRFHISRLLVLCLRDLLSLFLLSREGVCAREGRCTRAHTHSVRIIVSLLRIALQSARRSAAYIPYPAQNRGRISAPKRTLLADFLRRLSWLGGVWPEPPLPAPHKGNLLSCRGGAGCSRNQLPLQLPLCSIDERHDLHSDWVTLTHSVC